eukprot:SAG22_NODE_706_length_7763_cov_4.404228_7_plen_105_part_00
MDYTAKLEAERRALKDEDAKFKTERRRKERAHTDMNTKMEEKGEEVEQLEHQIDVVQKDWEKEQRCVHRLACGCSPPARPPSTSLPPARSIEIPHATVALTAAE